MSCSFCSDRKQFETFRERFGGPDNVQYCPLCGTPVYIQDILDYIEQELAKPLLETCTDDEGNILIVERVHTDDKPMSMELDLDKINIDREICLLAEHNGEAPWMTEYIKQSQRKQIIEYLNEKKKGDKENG